jgi:hypothetical protein
MRSSRLLDTGRLLKKRVYHYQSAARVRLMFDECVGLNASIETENFSYNDFFANLELLFEPVPSVRNLSPNDRDCLGALIRFWSSGWSDKS